VPFTSAAYEGIFTPQELDSLQKEYNLCCEMLGRLPTYAKSAFDYGDADIKLSAERAPNMARMLG
jgi:hypothetical protein